MLLNGARIGCLDGLVANQLNANKAYKSHTVDTSKLAFICHYYFAGCIYGVQYSRLDWLCCLSPISDALCLSCGITQGASVGKSFSFVKERKKVY